MAFTPFTESDQPTMANFNEKFKECIQESVQETMAQGRVLPFSYVGTGQWGPDNPNELTFDFQPRVIMLIGSGVNLPEKWIVNVAAAPTSYDSGWGFYESITSYQTLYGKKSEDGKSFSWYIRYDGSASDWSDMQCNRSGVTYYGLAFG